MYIFLKAIKTKNKSFNYALRIKKAGDCMTLIHCDENCIYQQDGYCQLETVSLITDCSQNGCIHKIGTDKYNSEINRQENLLHL